MRLSLGLLVASLFIIVWAAFVGGQRPTPATSGGDGHNETLAATTVGYLSREAWQHRLRNKNARLFLLQQHIMNNLQLKRKPNVTSAMSADEIEHIHAQFNRSQGGNDDRWNTGDNDDERKRFSVLRPTCPSITDRRSMRAWFAPRKYRLHFRVDQQDRTLPTRTKVQSSVLRLHRKPAVRNDANLQTGQRRRQPTGGARGKNDLVNHPKMKKIRSWLNLTISEYMAPVKHNRPELMKSVKTLRIRQNRSGWLTINIKSVVRQWCRRPTKNFGLEVKLINDDNEIIDPHTIFDGYSCSPTINNQDSLYSKFPSNGTTTVDSLDRQDDPKLYPNLEVVTVQVPRLHRTRTKHGHDHDRQSFADLIRN